MIKMSHHLSSISRKIMYSVAIECWVDFDLIFRYWWARLSILGKQEDWNELEKLSKIKKSPIGYEVKQLI